MKGVRAPVKSEELEDDSQKPRSNWGSFNTRKKPTLTMLLQVYDVFLRTDDWTVAAKTIGVDPRSMRKYYDKFPSFRKTIAIASRQRAESSSIPAYIFKRLSPQAKEIWEKIQFWDGCDNSTLKIDRILTGAPKRIRQEIFIHALVCSNFDKSEACRMANITKRQLDDWQTYDFEFRELASEIDWHKKNFFEKQLAGLVEAGHPNAVIFANKTFNADRGYNERIQVEHKKTGDSGIDLDELDLDMETRIKILDAVRRKNEAKLITSGPVIDVAPAEPKLLPEKVAA